jgi:flagellar hook-basal body complex protein FliE
MVDSISMIGAGPSGLGRMEPLMVPGFGVKPAETGAGFSALVQNASMAALTTLREGEAVTQAAVMGRVGTQEMVEAVMAMETSLRTTVAIRDKVVEAYQEILRMPI